MGQHIVPGRLWQERREDDVAKQGKHLFTFAVIADSHMTEADAAAKAEVEQRRHNVSCQAHFQRMSSVPRAL